MSEAPKNVWLLPTVHGNYYRTRAEDDPNAVRYVRADLYEALQARLAVVRSWNEAPCLEPLGELGKVQLLYRLLGDPAQRVSLEPLP